MSDLRADVARESGSARARPGARGRRRAAGSSGAGRFLILVFFIGLVVPIVMHLGPLRLAPYRIVVLLLFAPLFFMWIGGRYGGVQKPDVFVALYAAWGALALIVVHGVGAQWQASGVFVAEALGPYLLARVFIRTVDDFFAMTRALLIVIAALIPFVWIEAATGYRLISEALRGAFAVYGIAHQEMRWGMTRAQGPFEHPILFGVFASAGFALFYYAYGARRGGGAGALTAGVSMLATFFSLSLGAYLSVIAQLGLIFYDKFGTFLKNRWRLLIYGAVGIYVFLSVASNRGPIVIFIDMLSFNSNASWMRIAVFEYASAEALRNPLFGIGFNEFPRPRWVSWSVDNFWLLNALRYGMPALLFIVAAFVITLRRLAYARLSDHVLHGCRMGLIITMVGLIFALCTVHVWNASFSFLMFLLGSGAWLMDHAEPDSPPEPKTRRRRS